MNTTPNGFEYHWPSEPYHETDRSQNWFINFETEEIYISNNGRKYSFIVVDDKISFDGMTRRTGNNVIEAYLNYHMQKEILETQ